MIRAKSWAKATTYTLTAMQTRHTAQTLTIGRRYLLMLCLLEVVIRVRVRFRFRVEVRTTPYTLHPSPHTYTLHPTPYTLHPTPSKR